MPKSKQVDKIDKKARDHGTFNQEVIPLKGPYLGQTIKVSKYQKKRLSLLGKVADPGSKEAKQAQEERRLRNETAGKSKLRIINELEDEIVELKKRAKEDEELKRENERLSKELKEVKSRQTK